MNEELYINKVNIEMNKNNIKWIEMGDTEFRNNYLWPSKRRKMKLN